MELSDTKIKNFFCISWKWNPALFNPSELIPHTSGNRNHDEISYIFSKECFSDILGNGTPEKIIYINERNFSKFHETENLQNFLYFRN